ncbi:MAG TPA: GNAT family N-acetyltransferase [Blastocatellia bacterium]|nr:GNAT family N-acetyltransferase [Blastocatellia bacterium]
MIETARLRMRPFERGDVDELHRVFIAPGVRRFLLDDRIVPREWVEEEIAASIARFESGSSGLFCVYSKEDETLIGFCGFRPFFEPPELQLLYGLLPACWSKGLATEAARAMIAFGFQELAFDRVTASADAANAASLRVLEKAGMVFDRRATIDGLETLFYVAYRKPLT